MKKTKLGLPLEYQEMPEYFDSCNVSDDTETKNALIEKILRNHKVETVLDLTCGTGSQVFFLTKRGYKVTGADFSPDLLKIARKKAKKDNIHNIPAKFIDGDMRTLQVGQFDAAITIFNAVGHLTKSDFEKTMKNIHQNLKVGGLYVFDILNLQAISNKNIHDLAYHIQKKVNNTQILATQCQTIDKKNGLLTSYDSVMIQKNAHKPKRIEHEFKLQIYTAKQLHAMLKRNGFEIIEQYGMDGTAFIPNETISMLTIAKKIL